MEHIQAIQAHVDEHKERMPTGVVTKVMEHCQKAFNENSALAKVCVTWIHAIPYTCFACDEDGLVDQYGREVAHAKLQHQTQTLVAETVESWPAGVSKDNNMELLRSSRIMAGWLKNRSTPIVLGGHNNSESDDESMCIVHSITPLTSTEPKKRARRGE